MRFSKRAFLVSSLLLIASSLPALAEEIDPLSLLPEETSVLARVNLNSFVNATIFKSFEKDILLNISGYAKLMKSLEKAEMTFLEPAAPAAPAAPAEPAKPREYVKELYLAKSGINLKQDDIVALVVGNATLDYSLPELKKEMPDISFEIREEAGKKYYETKGLINKNETLFLVQMKGAIGAARTKESALAFLEREAQKEGAKGIRKNEVLNALANKLLAPQPGKPGDYLTVIVLTDEKKRKEFAEGPDADTKILQYVKSAWMRIGAPIYGNFEVEAQCECTDEEAAKLILKAIDLLRLKAILAAKAPEVQNLLSLVKPETTKNTVTVKIPMFLSVVKIIFFGPEKEKEKGKEGNETTPPVDIPGDEAPAPSGG